jgi:small subunit ribosomal protein S17e
MNEDLGKVRPEHVKKTAHELIELYRDKFSTDFQNNKEVVESLAQISSSKLRNRIAGYITRLVSAYTEETEESEAAEEENIEEKGELERN